MEMDQKAADQKAVELMHKHVDLMRGVRAGLRKAGLTGAALDAMAARLALPLGFDQRLTGAPGKWRLRPTSDAEELPLEEGLRAFCENEQGAAFLALPEMVAAAAHAFQEWATKTTAGKAFTDLDRQATRAQTHAQKQQFGRTIGEAMGFRFPEEGAERERAEEIRGLVSIPAEARTPGQTQRLKHLCAEQAAAEREDVAATVAGALRGPAPGQALPDPPPATAKERVHQTAEEQVSAIAAFIVR